MALPAGGRQGGGGGRQRPRRAMGSLQGRGGRRRPRRSLPPALRRLPALLRPARRRRPAILRPARRRRPAITELRLVGLRLCRRRRQSVHALLGGSRRTSRGVAWRRRSRGVAWRRRTLVTRHAPVAGGGLGAGPRASRRRIRRTAHRSNPLAARPAIQRGGRRAERREDRGLCGGRHRREVEAAWEDAADWVQHDVKPEPALGLHGDDAVGRPCVGHRRVVLWACRYDAVVGRRDSQLAHVGAPQQRVLGHEECVDHGRETRLVGLSQGACNRGAA